MLPSGWTKTTVGAACSIKNHLRYPINMEKRATIAGQFPYFGPTGILDYIDHFRIDEEFAVIGEDGDHFLKFRTKSMTLHFNGKANVNNHAHIIGDSESCSPKWFYFWFMNRDLTPALSRQGVGRYKLTKRGLENLAILLPPKAEQLLITDLLTTWDRAIVLSEQLIKNSLKQKQLLGQRMLTGRVRIQGFGNTVKHRDTPYGSLPQDWSYRQIGEVATEVSQRLGSASPHPVLSCTKHQGLVDSLSYFKKQIYSLDTSTYKFVPRGCFVYATNHIDEGSIGYQDLYDFGLVSPMYTAFSVNKELCDAYLFALLKTEHYRQIFASSTNASVDRRGSLRWKDFKKIRIPIPPIGEQVAIAKVLSLAEQDTNLLKIQLECLREEKTALKASLLKGKRRIRPA
jgi:type I restriction enzyme, S subunit